MKLTKYTLILFSIFILILPCTAFAVDTEVLERQVQQLALEF